jgi:archaellum component FlaF (FlaF/FlaG flagellin family)
VEKAFGKTTLLILINALFIGGVFIYPILRSLVRDVNSAQNEVKRLMLHDLHQKVEAMDEVSGPVVQKNAVGSF